MLIKSLALCATLLASGCIAVPVGPDYGGYGYGSYPSTYYSGTIIYHDRSPTYYRRYDGDGYRYRRYRDYDDRDHRHDGHGRGWDRHDD